MKTTVLCVFLFAAAWAMPKGESELQVKRLYVDPNIDGLPLDVLPRITNGVEAVPHSIPFQAYLIFSGAEGNWLCGGSLIAPTVVLTAGHCVDEADLVLVYLGAHDLQEAEAASRISVLSFELIQHEDYDADDVSNDVGLVILPQPVELNEYIGIVDLPSRGADSTYTGENVRISGWGRTAGGQGTSTVLREVNTTVITNEQCRQIYDIVIDSQLCTDGTGGVGSCYGDSGGPLVFDNVQIGVVSYGATGCPPGYPSGFTRVTSFLDWIEEKTGLNF